MAEPDWWSPESDLDVAAALLDDARHAIARKGARIDATEAVLFSSDAGRIVHEWEERRSSRMDKTPIHMRVGQRPFAPAPSREETNE